MTTATPSPPREHTPDPRAAEVREQLTPEPPDPNTDDASEAAATDERTSA